MCGVCTRLHDVYSTVEPKDSAVTNKIRQSVNENRRHFRGDFNHGKLETDMVIL